MADSIEFKFLKDEPVSKESEGFFKFYHESFSPALKEIVENDTCVHTIGLFGRWGSGKSTIIELLEKDLANKYKFFVFDAWKYQEDALRRIFLIKLVEFLKKKGVNVDEAILDPLNKATEVSSQVPVASIKKTRWQKARVVLNQHGVFISLILFVCIKAIIDSHPNDQTIAWAKNVISPILGIFRDLAIVGAAVAYIGPILKKQFDKAIENSLSLTQPLTEFRTKIEKQDRLNSPEQFERLFNDIVSRLEEREKLVIVFDNIDRVPGDTAIKILSTIKTFLDPKNKSGIVFLVPCDADAIEHQIRSFYGQENESFDSSEYLRKLFNTVIFTPEFIDTDLEEYTKKQLGQTGEISEYLLEEDVVFVITKAFSNNPREIKQFINNLVAATLVVSKTEVRNLILKKDKIGYLAKILVLKQKYPKAYVRLKEKWYDPGNILADDDALDLRNFLNNTSRITTDDAEPYLYFKKPVVATNLSDSTTLRQSLITGDIDSLTTQLAAETNKESAVEFILLLMKRYQGQTSLLFSIFTTQLKAVVATNAVITKRQYFNDSLQTLDAKLWQEYLGLPTDLIFQVLLNSPIADSKLKKQILDRYTLALSSEPLRSAANRSFMLELFRILQQHEVLFSGEQKKNITTAIEQHFSTDLEVFSIFQGVPNKQVFITPTSLERFIKNVARTEAELAIPVLISFSEYIEKTGLNSTVLKKIQEWVNIETTATSEFTPAKEVLINAINKLLNTVKKGFKDLTVEERQQFGQIITQAFNGISDWNNKRSLVITLRRIYPSFVDSQQSELKAGVDSFFRKASANAVEELLVFYSKEWVPTLLGEHIDTILTRIVSDIPFLNVVYKYASKEQRAKMIDHLVINTPNHGLDFVRSLGDDLPNREGLIISLLTKASGLPPIERTTIFNFVKEKSALSDGIPNKDAATAQIKQLLKTDELVSQQVGFEFLNGADFLGDVRRREIGKEILEFLRQPGKNITINHAGALNAVMSLSHLLQETLKKDLVFVVFDSLRQEKDFETLNMLTAILLQLRPSYPEHEKDYVDLVERIKTWPEGQGKDHVLKRLFELKPTKASSAELVFWETVEAMIPSVPAST